MFPDLLTGLAAGAACGVAVRSLFEIRRWRAVLDPFTAGHVFALPFAMGVLTGLTANLSGGLSWELAAGMPIATIAIYAACILTFKWQRLLSVLLNLPVFLGMALLGGLAALGTARLNISPAITAVVAAVVPVLMTALESRGRRRRRIVRVATSLDIDAPPEVIWERIVRVEPIPLREWGAYRLFALLGFPTPQRAELDFDGLDGLRLGIFSDRVLFEEPVAVWEPGRRVAFDIHVNAEAVNAMPFDGFTRIGGEYIELRRAEYVLEKLAEGRTRLHLNSVQCVTTRLNGYAAWWGRMILRAFQRNILALVKERCEQAANQSVQCKSAI